VIPPLAINMQIPGTFSFKNISSFFSDPAAKRRFQGADLSIKPMEL